MSDTNLTTAPASPVTTPPPAGAPDRDDTASPERRAEIERAMAEIVLDDSMSILFFGTAAQEEITGVTDEILERVRNRDTAAAGEALNEMVTTLRGLPVADLDVAEKPGAVARLFRRATPLARTLQRYEHVRTQIESIADHLDAHAGRLMKDVGMLDRLYDAMLACFRRLEVYIAAGDERLRRLDLETLPALAHEVGRGAGVLEAQTLADLRSARDELERRVHDLRLTRQVTMQALPSIRMVQQNDKALIARIASTLANTIPLWRQQLVIALAIARSADAGETLKRATDLTNDLLTANAESLRTSTQTIRAQVERGIVDIAAVKEANDTLIATIGDALRLSEDGRRQRAEAEKQLAACEADLARTLAAARQRGPGSRLPE